MHNLLKKEHNEDGKQKLYFLRWETPLLFHSHYLSIFQISVHPQMIKGLKRALLFRQLHICLRS